MSGPNQVHQKAVFGEVDFADLSPASQVISSRLSSALTKLERVLGTRANTEGLPNLEAIYKATAGYEPSDFERAHTDFWERVHPATQELKLLAHDPEAQVAAGDMLDLAGWRNPTPAKLKDHNYIIGSPRQVGHIGPWLFSGLSKGNYLWQAPWIQVSFPPFEERDEKEAINAKRLNVVTIPGWTRLVEGGMSAQSLRPGQPWLDLTDKGRVLDPRGCNEQLNGRSIVGATLKVPSEVFQGNESLYLNQFRQRADRESSKDLVTEDNVRWRIVESPELNGTFALGAVPFSNISKAVQIGEFLNRAPNTVVFCSFSTSGQYTLMLPGETKVIRPEADYCALLDGQSLDLFSSGAATWATIAVMLRKDLANPLDYLADQVVVG